MPRLFITSSAISGDRAVIDGPAARHLAGSLRIHAGETLDVVDDDGVQHTLLIESASPHSVVGRVLAHQAADGEPRLRVHVLQALAKDGMDDAIDAAVQAGATTITPVITDRTVVRLDAEKAARRGERWRLIARESAQLAFRGRVPMVADPLTLPEALAALPQGTRIVACVIAPGTVPLSQVDLAGIDDVALCIGPEGGFGDPDLAVLHEARATSVHLGPRVFRSRLAAALATTLLLSSAGDLATAHNSAVDGTPS